jgi:hypothetical protein
MRGVPGGVSICGYEDVGDLPAIVAAEGPIFAIRHSAYRQTRAERY